MVSYKQYSYNFSNYFDLFRRDFFRLKNLSKIKVDDAFDVRKNFETKSKYDDDSRCQGEFFIDAKRPL
jgi:hypothetical protein